MLKLVSTKVFFFDEHTKTCKANGVVEMLSEILDRYSTYAIKYEIAESALLLLYNLCFANKAHILSSPDALSLVLS